MATEFSCSVAISFPTRGTLRAQKPASRRIKTNLRLGNIGYRGDNKVTSTKEIVYFLGNLKGYLAWKQNAVLM